MRTSMLSQPRTFLTCRMFSRTTGSWFARSERRASRQSCRACRSCRSCRMLNQVFCALQHAQECQAVAPDQQVDPPSRRLRFGCWPERLRVAGMRDGQLLPGRVATLLLAWNGDDGSWLRDCLGSVRRECAAFFRKLRPALTCFVFSFA